MLTNGKLRATTDPDVPPLARSTVHISSLRCVWSREGFVFQRAVKLSCEGLKFLIRFGDSFINPALLKTPALAVLTTRSQSVASDLQTCFLSVCKSLLGAGPACWRRPGCSCSRRHLRRSVEMQLRQAEHERQAQYSATASIWISLNTLMSCGFIWKGTANRDKMRRGMTDLSDSKGAAAASVRQWRQTDTF